MKQRGKNTEDKTKRYILSNRTPFEISEAFKALRTNLMYSLVSTENKVIVITSAEPREGKSTTAANLAISLAQNGSHSLLIDADLRKPKQDEVFHLSNNRGFSTVLAGFSTFENSVHRDVFSGFDVLTAGPVVPNPSELLGRQKTKELIFSLEKDYDYIIIDTTPVNIVTDALVIMDEQFSAVLITRQKVTTYEQLKKAVDKISITKTDFLGVIVSDVTGEKKKYSKKYGYYHKYGGYYNYGDSYARAAFDSSPIDK